MVKEHPVSDCAVCTENVFKIIGQATYVEYEESQANVMDYDGDEIDALEGAASLFPPEETDIDRLIEVETMMMKEGENEEPENQEEVVNEVKSTDECLKYLRHINDRFIAPGLDPPMEITNFEDLLRRLPQRQSVVTDFFTKTIDQ